MSGHQFAIRIKPGERASIGCVSYIALIPHSILACGLHKEKFLVEYWKDNVLKKDWVSIKELEKRGVIKLINEVVITAPEGKENQLVMPKRLLHALIMSHFYLPCIAGGTPAWVLEREIKDIRIDGDSVIVVYEEEGE